MDNHSGTENMSLRCDVELVTKVNVREIFYLLHPGNKKMAKNDVNYIILMKILLEKNDDGDEKNFMTDRETDIIFHVFWIHA